MKKLLSIICLFSLSPYSYSENPLLDIDHSIIPKNITNNAIALRERALSDNLSVDIVESLTTEVGSRRMGTDGDQRAISWSLEKFRELGFDRFWTEEVLLDRGWVRGEAKAEILLVPQVTLSVRTNKGLKPSFSGAANPEKGLELFKAFKSHLEASYSKLQSGKFGANMSVSLINEGPITYWFEA